MKKLTSNSRESARFNQQISDSGKGKPPALLVDYKVWQFRDSLEVSTSVNRLKFSSRIPLINRTHLFKQMGPPLYDTSATKAD